MTMPSVYAGLRDWLNSKGANLTQHSTPCIIITLAGSFYDESEDHEAALEIAGRLVAEGRSSSRARTSTIAGGGMRFKERDSKFSGDIGQSWIEYVAEFQQVARDYGLSPTQKKQYSTTYFEGMQNDSTWTAWTASKDVLEHASPEKFVGDGADELSALEKVYKLITNISPQVPQSHRGEAHKIEFLRNSTVGELEAALHLEREARVAVLRDKASSGMEINDSANSTVPGILFEGQGRYMNRHKGVVIVKHQVFAVDRCQKGTRRPFDALV
eukprot:IDg3360t1